MANNAKNIYDIGNDVLNKIFDFFGRLVNSFEKNHDLVKTFSFKLVLLLPSKSRNY
jgi:hypothetical protein